MTTHRAADQSDRFPIADWQGSAAAAFESAGLAPPDRQQILSEALHVGDNLLPLLVALWDNESATGSPGETPAWLRRQQADGAALTVGFPGSQQAGVQNWLGPRLAWWPQGIPRGRTVGLASSRLGRPLDEKQAWFAMLRAACSRTDAEQDILVTAAATATSRFVVRAADLFERRLLCIEASSNDALPLDAWLSSLRSSVRAGFDRRKSRVLISPQLESRRDVRDAPPEAPVRDQALIALAQQLLVFHVRKRGHVMELLQRRLANGNWPAASVYVALSDQLIDRSSAATLMDAGAVGWLVPDGPRRTKGKPCRLSSISATAGASSNRISIPAADPWEYLTHCTRSAIGPWPDQDEDDYLDELILDRPEADHSAAAALERILREQCLAASEKGIRGGSAMVSFTAVPLAELNGLRIFRPHRGRWDFEPYGICIRKDWLVGKGARSVCYGTNDMWSSLAPEDQPFFQRHQSVSRRTGNTIDWTVEREWRTPGSLDLSALGVDDGFVFVPKEEDAARIAPLSRWPVVVVGAW